MLLFIFLITTAFIFALQNSSHHKDLKNLRKLKHENNEEEYLKCFKNIEYNSFQNPYRGFSPILKESIDESPKLPNSQLGQIPLSLLFLICGSAFILSKKDK